MSASLNLDLSQAPAVVRALLAGNPDFRPVLRTIALYLNSQARQCFAGQRAPDGTPWAKFKRPPSVKRGGATAKLLRHTGILMASLTGSASGHVEELTPTSLRWGTNVSYAKYHQFGTRTIPARPFLGITAEMAKRIVQILEDYLRRAAQ